MNTTFTKSILGGVLGTAVMTLIMFVAPMMGMPKMSPPDMLAGMMGFPIIMGWMMHFMVGIVFAFMYTLAFSKLIKVDNLLIKGAIFGFIVFVFAQIMMAVMGAVFPMPKPEGSMVLMMMGSIIGHLIYGSVTVKVIGKFA